MTIKLNFGNIKIKRCGVSLITKIYKRELLETKQNEESENGFDYKFIVNKIFIEISKQNTNYISLSLSLSRLNRLLVLVDIAYRQKNGKPLIKDEYRIWHKGLVVHKLYSHYMYQINEKELRKYEKSYQESIESSIDNDVNNEINELVSMVVNSTGFIDSVDLIELLKNNELQTFVEPNDITDRKNAVSHKFVTEFYKDFDFNKLKELNEREKEKFLGVEDEFSSKNN